MCMQQGLHTCRYGVSRQRHETSTCGAGRTITLVMALNLGSSCWGAVGVPSVVLRCGCICQKDASGRLLCTQCGASMA